MKIAVTGATGFIGRALCVRLASDGHRVIALVRNAARAGALLGAEVECAAWADEAAVGLAMANVDAVVNLAGEPILDKRWTAARKRELLTSRLAVTERLVGHLARRAPWPGVMISASAVGYYGDGGERELDERAGPGDDFAAHLCRDWEAAARAAEAHGARVVLARLGIVLGAGGGALASMLPMFSRGLGGRVGSGEQWVPWIHLDDAVAALARALEDGGLRGPVNVVAPAPVRNRELAAELGRALGRPARLPAPALALRAALGERAALLLGSQRAVPRVLEAVGFSFRYGALPEALAAALEGA